MDIFTEWLSKIDAKLLEAVVFNPEREAQATIKGGLARLDKVLAKTSDLFHVDPEKLEFFIEKISTAKRNAETSGYYTPRFLRDIALSLEDLMVNHIEPRQLGADNRDPEKVKLVQNLIYLVKKVKEDANPTVRRKSIEGQISKNRNWQQATSDYKEKMGLQNQIVHLKNSPAADYQGLGWEKFGKKYRKKPAATPTPKTNM